MCHVLEVTFHLQGSSSRRRPTYGSLSTMQFRWCIPSIEESVHGLSLPLCQGGSIYVRRLLDCFMFRELRRHENGGIRCQQADHMEQFNGGSASITGGFQEHSEDATVHRLALLWLIVIVAPDKVALLLVTDPLLYRNYVTYRHNFFTAR